MFQINKKLDILTINNNKTCKYKKLNILNTFFFLDL